MTTNNGPTPAQRVSEASYHDQSEHPIEMYKRGLITFDEFVALLCAIRLDEAGWTHAAATFPHHTINAFARLLDSEGEEANRQGHRRWAARKAQAKDPRPWASIPAEERTALIEQEMGAIEAAVEDEHSHGGTPTLDDGCGR